MIGENIFRCKKCRSNFSSETRLQEHQTKGHSNENLRRKGYKCRGCKEIYFRKYLIINHMKKKHNNLKLICERCSGEFYLMNGN